MTAPDGANLATTSPIPTTCTICGAALGIEARWVVDHPKQAHERCIDWAARPFPYAWRIAGLELVVRRVVDDALVVAQRCLRVHRRALAAWPTPALVILDVCGREANAARAQLSRLGVERRLLERF